MFSQTAEYALRAVVLMAEASSEGGWDNKTLAKQAQVPTSYLAKVLQSLTRAGITRSKRGSKGGFALARPPQEITILEVVNAVDPIARIKKCPLGLRSHCEILCPMHHRLDRAMAEVENVLGNSTIAELLADTSRPKPMQETIRFLPIV
ncbi:MAG: Rrf2 family transcriptional regulator [Candidatus Eremiobacteraeota bacterium]|nr:Rrf2 family transcriptional regulator [Candidatus Eremiobacteraeota bacterium]MCW5872393.1 Rrf2 family transcriptional regulator [Candidatus Eremiobacteraeota bacterium]